MAEHPNTALTSILRREKLGENTLPKFPTRDPETGTVTVHRGTPPTQAGDVGLGGVLRNMRPKKKAKKPSALGTALLGGLQELAKRDAANQK